MGSKVEVSEEIFGEVDSIGSQVGKQTVKIFKLKNENGVQVELINYGASVVSLQVPDRNGQLDDIVLGFDDLPGYLGVKARNPFFGAVVGRVANRIAKGKFCLEGKEYTLATNNGVNHLHGGIHSFGRILWQEYIHPDGQITFSYSSPHMDEGYPGHLLAQVTYKLSDVNELLIDFKALTTSATPVNLASHAYFNLAGHSSGSSGLLDHVVELNAEFYTPVDDTLIPTGEISPVNDSPFDLRNPTRLGDVIDQVPGGGYDHNFVINPATQKRFNESLPLVGKFSHPGTGRNMEVYTDQPGFQFYTGNFLPSDGSLIGKKGTVYSKHGGFCVETQNYPNAVNQPNFPNCILRPGDIYQRRAVYKFGVQ